MNEKAIYVLSPEKTVIISRKGNFRPTNEDTHTVCEHLKHCLAGSV